MYIPQNDEPKRIKSYSHIVIPIAALLAIVLIVTFFLSKPLLDYKNAEALLNEGNYTAAHAAFLALGDYSDSRKRAQEVKEEAFQQALLPSSGFDIVDYAGWFGLTEEQYLIAYSYAIDVFNRKHVHWQVEEWSGTAERRLSVLPDSYRDVAVYKKLTKHLLEKNTICAIDRDFVKENFDIPYIRSIPLSENETMFFMLGEWESSDGSKRFAVLRNKKGEFSYEYNLPTDTPAPIHSLSVTGSEFEGYDQYGSLLGDIFKLNIISFDTVEITSVADNSVVTLHRQ